MVEFQARFPTLKQARCQSAGGAETQEQVRLTFPTLEQALAYAAREGVDAHVVPPAEAKLKLQAYADNFR